MANLMHINKDYAQQLVEKWSPVLDFKSDKVSEIANETTRLNTAILLENQEKWCLREAGNSAATGGVFGAHQGTEPLTLVTTTLLVMLVYQKSSSL